MVYLYGPADVVALYVKQAFKRTDQSDGLTIGEPIYEAAGVPDRRGLVAHSMTGEQTAYANRVVRARGHHGVVFIADVFPADWRYPAPA